MANMLFKSILILIISTNLAFSKGFDLTNKNSDAQIEITADDSLEWQQENNVLIANKNAFVKRGTVNLKADMLKAFYKTINKKNDIYLVSGGKNVVIENLNEKASGDTITYDIEQGVMVLKGNPAKAITKGNTLTSDVIEYWQFREMAVARGHAKVVKDDGKTVSAKIMTAYFSDKNKNKDLEIEKIDLFDDIVFTGENEKIYADRARYNLKTMIIRLEGNVKIERGENYLTGAYAIVNMKTGISKLFKNPDDKVKGVFIPEEYKKKDTNNDKKLEDSSKNSVSSNDNSK